MTDGAGYSLSDVAALMNNRDSGFLEGNGIIILILFFLIFGFNGNGWGVGNAAAQGALTRSDMYEGFNSQTIERKLDGITNGLCDGFYAQNTTMLTGFNTLGQEINNNRFASQQCCCETNRNIDSVKYENSQNTCAITSNQTANTQKILDKLCQMEGAAKDQRIADLAAANQNLTFQLSQLNQNATIINTLQPVAKPAYLTASPYQQYANYANAYGFGCGCGY